MVTFFSYFRICILISYIFCSSEISSQTNVVRFEKDLYTTDGLSQNSKIVSTKDLGYVVYGNIMKPGTVYHNSLTKLDSLGNLKWSYSYSLNTDSCVYGLDCINTFDNGFVICGSTSKRYSLSGTTYFAYITKLDSLGNIMWSKVYPYSHGSIYRIKQFSDSSIMLMLNYLIGSVSVSVLQKLDKNGNILWSKKINYGSDFYEKSNKNIQVFFGGLSIILKEFDQYGNDIWEKNYKTTKWFYNAWKMDINKEDETVIISDLFDSTGAKALFLFILKINNGGNIAFSNYYLGDWISCQTYSGGFTKDCEIIINTRLRFNSIERQGMLKVFGDGSIDWLKTYPHPNFVFSKYVINTSDFGFASLGESVNGSIVKARIIKTDIDGKSACNIDSIILSIKKPNPMLVDSILHPTFFTTINSINSSVFKYINNMSIAHYCVDETIVDSLKECVKNKIDLHQSYDIFIPNVFTPNGDNKNDLFKINIKNYKNFKINIYNRWGGDVFESNDPLISWDGKINNTQENANDGVYYYILTNLDKLNQTKKHKGYLTLIR